MASLIQRIWALVLPIEPIRGKAVLSAHLCSVCGKEAYFEELTPGYGIFRMTHLHPPIWVADNRDWELELWK